MKKKVKINREKISSEEIASGKNFRALVKKYPTIGNPFRRSSWRMKGFIWLIIIIAVLVYCTLKGLI